MSVGTVHSDTYCANAALKWPMLVFFPLHSSPASDKGKKEVCQRENVIVTPPNRCRHCDLNAVQSQSLSHSTRRELALQLGAGTCRGGRQARRVLSSQASLKIHTEWWKRPACANACFTLSASENMLSRHSYYSTLNVFMARRMNLMFACYMFHFSDGTKSQRWGSQCSAWLKRVYDTTKYRVVVLLRSSSFLAKSAGTATLLARNATCDSKVTYALHGDTKCTLFCDWFFFFTYSSHHRNKTRL